MTNATGSVNLPFASPALMNDIRLHASDEAFQAVPPLAAILKRRGENPVTVISAPAVVCCPTVACVNWLKRALLAQNAPLLNVRFLTPPTLRKWLATRAGLDSLNAAQPLDVECLAKTFLRRGKTSLPPSSARLLVETLQSKIQSGPGARLNHAQWEGVTEQFARVCRDSGLLPGAMADEILFERIQRGNESLQGYELFLYGFNARHWPSWRLLVTAASGARSANVFLSFPRVVAEKPGFWWMGSWEEIGETSDGPGVTAALEEFTDEKEMSHLAQIARAMDQGVAGGEGAGRVIFHAASDCVDEARVIAAQILHWLKDSPEQSRVGVVLSNHPALAAEVCVRLEQWGIPVRNEYGEPEAAAPWQRLLSVWLELWNGDARADAVSRFFREYGDAIAAFFNEAKVSPEKIDGFLSEAFAALLTDRLMVYGNDGALKGKMPPPLGKFSRAWAEQFALPEAIECGQLRGKVDSAIGFLRALEPAGQWDDLRDAFGQWLDRMDSAGPAQIAREDVCEWFGDKTLPDLEKVTGHPESVVTVTTPERAEAQAWDYLFVGGLNEGLWPAAPQPHPLVDDRVCEDWNRAALKASRHGEGVECFASENSALLTSQARRMLDREQFLNLIASARVQVAASCSVFDRSKNNLPLSPSEFYQRLFTAAHGGILSAAILDRIHSLSVSLLANCAGVMARQNAEDKGQRHRILREIFDGRSNPEKPFDEYSYCIGDELPEKIIFSAKDWQEVRQRPATMWYRYLKLRPRPAFGDITSVLSLHRGTLIHEWIRQSLLSQSVSAGDLLLRKLRVAGTGVDHAAMDSIAAEQLARFHSSYEKAGLRLPVQWREEVGRSKWAVGRILDGIADELGPWWFETEYKKGARQHPVSVSVGAATLESYGKIDLILADHENPAEAKTVKVIDFKTSASRSSFDKANNTQLFRHGDYLQVALYALFHADECGSRKLFWAVHNPYYGPGRDNELPGDPEQLAALLGILEKTQKHGVFGQREALDEEYGIPTDLPTACLPIDKDILLARWELTFGGANR
ncbi:PD-(D/E)XK nuclease family protein [Oscillatoria amoena NRMC-F 0135]|nr:PD-(D/E)XK nuclease family protein [Oscillatoria amoena NRMC-F 0135]